ncbi:isochorismate synthase [Xenophilus arseniciresistens]|uniref:isochorismate synthase n=1 Tax=Xenophilus arseniciresistens TaxID=1283306 RepID=A0AAE3SZ24_9BURK|nr:isochorismate synthase [Xenophilus arseniciresistens]MDA7416644.1 isochorismate synthase [Xenophilus arseniciresistens]
MTNTLAASATHDDGRAHLLLQSHEGSRLCEGVAAVLSPALPELGAAVARHFASPLAVEAGLLAGALPFDRAQAAHLMAPQRLVDAAPAQAWLQRMAARGDAPAPWAITPQPSRTRYEEAVAQAVQRLRGPDALHKVVLARTLRAHAAQPVNPWRLLQRLAGDPGVMRYVVPLPVPAGEAPAWLVGATPELLLSRRGARIVSEPLAGSAARVGDAVQSQALADALRGSAKDQQEHRYVVQAIADLLAPLCRQLRVPDAPSLHATATMWHLGTRIEGELKDSSPEGLGATSSAALAALLHPTPAVCGTPRALAAQAIAELESVPRGFYAGAVGWCDATGDGDWHVALRCARVQGHEARLFAGAGIVADSVPALEGAETRAKFNAMLNALELDLAALPSDL